MAENGLTAKVLDTLIGAGLLTAEQVESIRESSAAGKPVGAALLERGLVTSADVGTVLEDEIGVPRVDLASYSPDEEALALVPPDLARKQRILPLFEIDGTLTVAVGDPMDVLMLDDLAKDLGVELDPVLTDTGALQSAIATHYGEPPAKVVAEPEPEMEPIAASPSSQESMPAFIEPVPDEPPPLPPVAEFELASAELAAEDLSAALAEEMATEVPAAPVAAASLQEETRQTPVETIEHMAESTVPAGRPPVDLDVLAVADSTRVALLVTDILADAASRGASRIHLLPYKDDFFLVYRVKGRLEKVASAPLSLQGALIEGFKSFGRIGAASGVPALGRVRSHLADQDLVLTISVVPTIAGQRLVTSLAPVRREPRDLQALGMSEAEARALHVMVERGRGILLVAAPIAEGRSATYYALLAHAAEAGKTVYSVEQAIEYEIPAVAQVMLNSSSPIPASSYFAAGLRQDTDVVAIDGLTSVEDIHLAVKAAGTGRLVIATLPASDIVSAVRRMLDLGAEPYSLASALTLAVGQRLVRVNCPNCTVEKASPLQATFPGLAKGMVNRTGTGCPNCGKTGFSGLTGMFEVLPFSEPIRIATARNADDKALSAAAKAAGMRPLVTSGLAKVAAGEISIDELERVLRLAR